jgi:hypothetical protein
MQRVELPTLLTRFGELELENALQLRVIRKLSRTNCAKRELRFGLTWGMGFW